MKLRQDQLAQHLSQGLAPFYLVSGDEPLLVQEACDAILNTAKAHGANDKETFHADAGFSWADLHNEASALSLFASKRVLIVRIANGKPSDKGETLMQLAQTPAPDTTVLVVLPKLDSRVQSSKWFKTLEKHGVFIQVWPIERNQFAGWLKHRLQQAGLQIEPAALALLAQQTEGNLLAGVQEIEKFKLSGITALTEADVSDAIGDNARYDAFELANACLLGKLSDACRVLTHLQHEGAEPLLILGALTRNIRQLISLSQYPPAQLENGFKAQRIWPRQQKVYRAALKRLTPTQLHRTLQQAEAIDAAAKGSGDDAWRLLSELVVALAHGELFASNVFHA